MVCSDFTGRTPFRRGGRDCERRSRGLSLPDGEHEAGADQFAEVLRRSAYNEAVPLEGVEAIRYLVVTSLYIPTYSNASSYCE
jgi:hypothetical protein